MNEPKHTPEVYLCTSLVIAGGELMEMAGAITERGSASDFNLKRAEKAVQKAAEALAEYRRIDDRLPYMPHPRPSYHKQAEGFRADHMLPGYGDDGPGEAA